MKIAIIGGGVIGVTLAWLLADSHEVVLYEESPELGGSHRTLDIETSTLQPQQQKRRQSQPDVQQIQLETSNALFFPHYHKNFAALLEYLDIYSEPCPASYYNRFGNNFKLRSILNRAASFHEPMAIMKNNVIRKELNILAKDLKRHYHESNIPVNLSLRQYIHALPGHNRGTNDVLFNLFGVLWNYPPDQAAHILANKAMLLMNEGKVLESRASNFMRYVPSFSAKYIQKLLFKGNFVTETNSKITEVKLRDGKVDLAANKRKKVTCDKLIFACSSDSAAQMIDPILSNWHKLLENIKYVTIPMHIHQDPALCKDFAATTMGALGEKAIEDNFYSHHFNLGKINKIPVDMLMSYSLRSPPQHIVYEGKFKRPYLGVSTRLTFTELQEMQGKSGMYFCADGADHSTSPLIGKIKAACDLAMMLGTKPPFPYA